MTELANNLAVAWAQRANLAVETLRHADAAPALFKPEYVEQVRADYAKAAAWSRYWMTEA